MSDVTKSTEPAADERRSEMRMHRILYSLGDFHLASSALAFLADFDAGARYSKPDLRRFRCYETTAIVAYTRPFSSQSSGGPALSHRMIGLTLSPEQSALHQELVRNRNKVFAHSDHEMMRMRSAPFSLEMEGGESLVFPQIVFNEYPQVVDLKLIEFSELVAACIHGVVKTCFPDMQTNPSKYEFVLDREC